MIKQFRSLHPLNLVFLVVVILLLRLPTWSQQSPPINSGFQELAQRLLLPETLFSFSSIAQMLSLVCIAAQALLFNKVINNHNLLAKASFMPALLFVVCSSFADTFATLSPVLICNFLIIWMLNQFFNIYRQQEIRSLLYDLGMVAATGTIIYPPFALMFPIIWVGLMIFRPFNAREWFVALMGFATPFFFLVCYYYWNDQLGRFKEIWMPSTTLAPFQFLNPWVLMIWLVAGILGMIQLRSNFFRSVVHIRKSFQLLSVFFLASIFSSNPKFGAEPNHYLLAAAPVSVLLAYYFMHANKRWFYETLFLAMIGVMLYFQLF